MSNGLNQESCHGFIFSQATKVFIHFLVPALLFIWPGTKAVLGSWTDWNLAPDGVKAAFSLTLVLQLDH